MALRKIRHKIVPKNCPFCKEKTEPYYREVEILRKYVSERGKILSHLRTGICSKHQRRVAKQLKHARFLSFIPFINR
ncbi:MAG: 30S ribosomal protein S18 [Candidatus Gottesmanbacteria bacterium GW2011_GWA1_34_13]|uniref:Small ribosomal subunit protein bS18 n=1 Tax=Candidatus Gottesmanbacteria bacterium GW2011_GWA1_34_13 TaxID=1618434 RepID=A0A0G0D7S0_9BACT|nr:MAG: 30S ribosomal protein S18 [Candidatus Gottesmanbacteria bacterium GW2011_GWA1_34_13]